MKNALFLLLPGIVLSGAICFAAESHENDAAARAKTSAAAQPTNGMMQPYLGVFVEPTHRALVSQLLHLLGEGHGALVAQVSAGSPAEKAGVKEDDIIVSYEGQKLFGPEQLIKMVQTDKPGHQVTLGIIHAGKSEQLKVTLGEHHMAARGDTRRTLRTVNSAPDARHHRSDEAEVSWLNFDAMTLKRNKDGKFAAEIDYRDDHGKIESRHFEGTREQLRKDIDAEKDLPALEREHLLHALGFAHHPMALETAP